MGIPKTLKTEVFNVVANGNRLLIKSDLAGFSFTATVTEGKIHFDSVEYLTAILGEEGLFSLEKQHGAPTLVDQFPGLPISSLSKESPEYSCVICSDKECKQYMEADHPYHCDDHQRITLEEFYNKHPNYKRE